LSALQSSNDGTDSENSDPCEEVDLDDIDDPRTREILMEPEEYAKWCDENGL